MKNEITDRVKSFDDILSISGRNASDFEVKDGHSISSTAYRKLELISEVLNEGTELNPLDKSQWKYFPWHILDENSPSGFGLSCCDYGGWRTSTTVGVHICFKSAELAIFAGKLFIGIYAEHYFNKK